MGNLKESDRIHHAKDLLVDLLINGKAYLWIIDGDGPLPDKMRGTRSLLVAFRTFCEMEDKGYIVSSNRLWDISRDGAKWLVDHYPELEGKYVAWSL